LDAEGHNSPGVEPVTNPSATGGAGPDFEFKVGAACLTLLLTRGAPFFLGTDTLSAVHFQTKHLGWQTDDLLLEAVNSLGANGKAAIQVKRSFVLSENDGESVETLRRAFADFRNPTLFDQNRDVVGLITSGLSAKLVRGLRALLDCARASTDSADMLRRLQIPGYLGKPALNYYHEITAILRGAGGPPPADAEIWHFLCRFNVVDCDLNVEHGFVETMMRSLLAVTAHDKDPAAAADATWNTLCVVAATHYITGWRVATAGGVTTLEELGADVRWFLSLPLPAVVWKKNSQFKNQQFVEFVERAVNAGEQSK